MSSLSFSFRFYCIIQFSRYKPRFWRVFAANHSLPVWLMWFSSIPKLFNKLIACLVGSSGLEPPTSRLSGVRSNHLSYEPV